MKHPTTPSPIFKTWYRHGRIFLAVPHSDGWYIIDDSGLCFGAWQEVENFRREQRGATALGGDTSLTMPLPDILAAIAMRTYAKPPPPLPETESGKEQREYADFLDDLAREQESVR